MLGPNQDVLPPQSEAITLFSLLEMIADPEKTRKQLTVWLETKQSVEKAQAELQQQRQALEKFHDDLKTQQLNLSTAQNKLRSDQQTHDEQVVAIQARETEVAARHRQLTDRISEITAFDQKLRTKEQELKALEAKLNGRRNVLDGRALDLDAAEKAHADRVSKLKALIA